MSGGSYDYVFHRIEALADLMESRESSLTPLRARFAEHLRLVAAAAKEIEWVDSGDSEPGAEDEFIIAVFNDKLEEK